MKKSFYLFLLIFLNFNCIFSQSDNLGQFDDKLFHFGFALSSNNSSFNLEKSFPGNDSLLSVLVLGKPGFSLGVVSSININPNFKIRFVLPTLSFTEKTIEYTFAGQGGVETIETKKLDPTYLEFPILFKFRTDRIHNFAVYGITGFKYGIDMTSNIDANNGVGVSEHETIKLEKTDFSTEIGGGVDIFLKYFKLGIELKLASGMRNLLYLNQDKLIFKDGVRQYEGEVPTVFENSIQSLKSKVWTLSFTFEG
jgi:hypothetical protein